jgi:hypothetical protein
MNTAYTDPDLSGVSVLVDMTSDCSGPFQEVVSASLGNSNPGIILSVPCEGTGRTHLHCHIHLRHGATGESRHRVPGAYWQLYARRRKLLWLHDDIGDSTLACRRASVPARNAPIAGDLHADDSGPEEVKGIISHSR